MYKYLIVSALIAIACTSVPTLQAATASSGIGETLNTGDQLAYRGYGGWRGGRGFGGYGGYNAPYNYYYTRPYYNAYPYGGGYGYYYTNPYNNYYYSPGLSFQFGW